MPHTKAPRKDEGTKKFEIGNLRFDIAETIAFIAIERKR
jgi:hypothetical protein